MSRLIFAGVGNFASPLSRILGHYFLLAWVLLIFASKKAKAQEEGYEKQFCDRFGSRRGVLCGRGVGRRGKRDLHRGHGAAGRGRRHVNGRACGWRPDRSELRTPRSGRTERRKSAGARSPRRNVRSRSSSSYELLKKVAADAGSPLAARCCGS